MLNWNLNVNRRRTICRYSHASVALFPSVASKSPTHFSFRHFSLICTLNFRKCSIIERLIFLIKQTHNKKGEEKFNTILFSDTANHTNLKLVHITMKPIICQHDYRNHKRSLSMLICIRFEWQTGEKRIGLDISFNDGNFYSGEGLTKLQQDFLM